MCRATTSLRLRSNVGERVHGFGLDRGLGDPPYNFILQSAPYGMSEAKPWYRWHLVVMPTLGRVAGFEWGTGFYINPTAPEEAADFLRSLR